MSNSFVAARPHGKPASTFPGLTLSQSAVAKALSWCGTPYRHQASKKHVGCDCLGLIRGVWRELYGDEPFDVPAYGADARRMGVDERLKQAAKTWLEPCTCGPKAGQVILLRLMRHLPPRHCGIMIDDTRFVHAQERLGVVITSLEPGWAKRVDGFYSFPEI